MGCYVDVSVKLKSNIKLCASIVLALVAALKLFSSLFRPWNLVKPDLPCWLLLLLSSCQALCFHRFSIGGSFEAFF